MKNSSKQTSAVRKIEIIIAMFTLFSFLGISPSFSDTFTEIKGKHFTVTVEGDASFGDRVLREAEKQFDRIASMLDFAERDAWLWENRCAIFVYQNKESYVQHTGRPEWSNASSEFGPGPEIHLIADSATLFEAELPHEITHLLFRQSVGIDNEAVPHWLDEGLALWQEQESPKKERLSQIAGQNAAAGTLSLANLEGASEELAPAAWASPESISAFYAESYSVVDFLISRFGEARFKMLLRNLKEGMPLEQSVQKTYGSAMRDLADMEREWRSSLEIYQSS